MADNKGIITKDDAKKRIQEIINGFEDKRDDYSKTDEANIETKLLEPLFEALGWTKNDFEKREKVQRKEGRGISDYAFKLNGRTVFFLEAKKVSVDVNKDKATWKQAISYALSKRVPFAVLSNFETLKIFCVEQKNALSNQFRDLKYTEFTDRFEDLWLLSKESFEKNLILERAVREQRLKKRVSMDSELLEDLMRSRKLIADDIEDKYPKKYDINEKDDIIQRLLDRLIFIRRAEDIGINRDKNNNYIELLKEVANLPENKIYPKLKEIFSRYDEIYNSGLFAKGTDSDVDSINLDGTRIKTLLTHLYESRDKEYIYNFDWIDADVLGQVYEQYLGKILQQKKSGISNLKDGQAHKKEQGIYYTPTYIVDYIVKNTVGEALKDKKADAAKIKVLDPACGSGSFLIKAFDYVHEGYKKKYDVGQRKIDASGVHSIKTDILKNNIFGVDLDNKAVEITKLNLLLKAAEAGRKLPKELDLHIRNGNSLIDDNTVAPNKAFKWDEKFSDIIQYDARGNLKDGYGFDIVIGNPPYVRPHKISLEDKKFFWKHLKTFKAKSDLYNCFMEKGIDLTKNGGIFSFIVPHTWTSLESFYEIRKYILDNCKIVKLVQLPKKVFQEATVETCIFVLSKENNPKKRENNKIVVEKLDESERINFVKEYKQSQIRSNHLFNFELYSETSGNKILNKIKEKGIKLGTLVEFSYGLKTGDDDKFVFDDPKNSDCKKLLRSKDVERYYKKFNGVYVWYVPELMIKNKTTARPGDKERFESEKIIVARMGKKVVATYDNEKYYVKDAMLLLKKSEESNLKYIVGILNSNVINYFYKSYFITIDVLKNALLELPIAPANRDRTNKLSERVEKIEKLNSRLAEFGGKKTPESAQISEEIARIDAEIDELVYTIYGITNEEKRVIEESLK